jgi:hypothetical protein
MDKEISCESVDLISVAQVGDQGWYVLNTVMKIRVAYKAGNLLTS